MQTQTCRVNDVTGDPSMPLMRDFKRFVRKCPKLGLLGTVLLFIVLWDININGVVYPVLIQSGMERPVEVRGPSHGRWPPRPRSVSMCLSSTLHR
jgi:hypothetical protein